MQELFKLLLEHDISVSIKPREGMYQRDLKLNLTRVHNAEIYHRDLYITPEILTQTDPKVFEHFMLGSFIKPFIADTQKSPEEIQALKEIFKAEPPIGQ